MNNVNVKALDHSKFTTATSYASPLTKSTVLNNNNRNSRKLIANYFSQVQALAGKPVFSVLGNKVVVNVFYFIPQNNLALNNSTINSLGEVLSKLYKCPVELRLVRLYYPYMNSYILAQYITMNTRKYNFKAIINSLFSAIAQRGNVMAALNSSSTSLPSQIVGLKVKISGRLATQRSVPRQTTQTAQIGSFSSSVIDMANKPNTAKAKGLVEYAAFSSKNKKGAFTVKVWISQKAYPSI